MYGAYLKPYWGPPTEWGPGQNAPVAPPVGSPKLGTYVIMIICATKVKKQGTAFMARLAGDNL